jgi:U2 small nuclear ribonucleoprotein B''
MNSTNSPQPIIGPNIVSASAPVDLGLPHATLYVQNLPEKLRFGHLQAYFRDTCVRSNVALRRVILRRGLAFKGQCWLLFGSIEEAKRAVALMQGTRLLGKSLGVRFARFPTSRNPQDVLQRQAYRRQRPPRMTLRQRRLQMASNAATMSPSALASVQPQSQRPLMEGLSTAEALQMPNKILFLQDIPDGVDGSELTDIFKRFPGFGEVRVVPTRRDVAFVEFDAELQAVHARNTMDRQLLRPNALPLRVTFAKH